MKHVYDAGCDALGWTMAAGTWVTAFATLPAGLAVAASVKAAATLPTHLGGHHG